MKTVQELKPSRHIKYFSSVQVSLCIFFLMSLVDRRFHARVKSPSRIITAEARQASNLVPCKRRIPDDTSLSGLKSPAIVADSIVVHVSSASRINFVTYFIDGQEVFSTDTPPFYLSSPGVRSGVRFSLSTIPLGYHTMFACSHAPDGSVIRTDEINFDVIPDINHEFSSTLTPYTFQPNAESIDIDVLLARTKTHGVSLSASEESIRSSIFAMYVNWGIDPSLDVEHDQSIILRELFPKGAASPKNNADKSLSMKFSPDAPFYHRIPRPWPRVLLPSNYVSSVQLSEAYSGDGIGFGEVTASASDPVLPVKSQWYHYQSTLRQFMFRMPQNWYHYLPTLQEGDRHLIFIDSTDDTFVSTYKASLDHQSGGVKALFASDPHSFSSLGDTGGSNAAGFAELPVMIQPGEATNPTQEIPHAIGGAIHRVWAARVYPASSWDADVLTSVDTCSNKGFMNTGLVPYGGIIQLDPDLNLASLKLSLPTFRILRAMQVYGYYVMDFGCADLDIYTAIDAAELEPFGGPYGNSHGIGVQNELRSVISTSRIYVVPPPTKR